MKIKDAHGNEYAVIRKKKAKGLLEGLIEGALSTGGQVAGFALNKGYEGAKAGASALRIISEGLTEETCKQLDKFK
jgi:hypothetical protein